MNKTYLLVLATALFLFGSCTKVEVVEVQGGPIAEKIVPVTAGSFMLPVTSNEEERFAWKLRSLSDWLHVDSSISKSEWNFNNQNVRINYDSNESWQNSRNFARVGYLVLETYDKFEVDTIIVKQRGLTPSMKLPNVTVGADVAKCEIPFNTNLTDQCRPSLKFSASQAWVKSVKYLGNGTHLEVVFANNYGAERSAEILAIFTDALGEVFSAKCVLTQAAYVAPEPEPEPEPNPGEGNEPGEGTEQTPGSGENTQPEGGNEQTPGSGENTQPEGGNEQTPGGEAGTEQTNPENVK